MERANSGGGVSWIGCAAVLALGLPAGAQDGEAAAIELGAARARLVLEIERDAAAALAQLEELEARAQDPAGFPGQAEAQAVVAAARGEILAALGQGDPAQGPDAGQDEGRDTLRGTVEFMVIRGDMRGLRDLGRPALRVLEEMTLETRQELAPGSLDPLTALFQLAPLEAARLLLEAVEGSSELFQRRVLREMAGTNVLTKDGVWDCPGERPPTLLEPVWRELLERLVRHAGSVRHALPLLRELARRDALTAPLLDALRGALFSAQPDLVKESYLAIADLPGLETIRPLYEALLEHPEAALRQAAARTLGNYRDMGGLLLAVHSPDAAVRGELARALGNTTISWIRYQSNCGMAAMSGSHPRSRPEEHEAIRILSDDPDPEVRGLAVRAAGQSRVELPREVLLRLAEDDREELLRTLALLPLSDPAVLGALLERLAHSEHVEVLEQVAKRLNKHAWQAEPEVLLPPLEALLLREPPQTDRWPNLRSTAVNTLWGSPTAAAAVVRWTLEREDRALLGLVLAVTANGSYPGFSDLPQEQSLELLRRWAVAEEADPSAPRRLGKAIGKQTSREVLVAAAGLGELPLGIRLNALHKALNFTRVPGADLERAILGVLADPRWSTADSVRGHELRNVAQGAGGELWNRVAAAALADPEFDPQLLELVVGYYDPLSPGGKEVARAVLARWPVPGDRVVSPVARALRQARELGLEPELLERGLERYSLDVVDAMSRWRDPFFLPSLTRALEPEWLSAGDRGAVQSAAIAGLENLLSDEAARALLAFAERTGSKHLREKCFAALETIRTYQEARERWDRRVAEREARAKAIEHLLPLLADADPARRAVAVLALGQLGEARHLPRIAELATDPDETVRAAALEALRRLRRNEEPAPPPQPEPRGEGDR